jgi:hypothetical protein
MQRAILSPLFSATAPEAKLKIHAASSSFAGTFDVMPRAVLLFGLPSACESYLPLILSVLSSRISNELELHAVRTLRQIRSCTRSLPGAFPFLDPASKRVADCLRRQTSTFSRVND